MCYPSGKGGFSVRTYRDKVFPCLAEALWLIFLFLDLSGLAESTWIKFAGICLCGLTACTGAKTADGKLVSAALALTVCADVFLLLLNRGVQDQLIGVSIFLAVQLLYAYRLYHLRGSTACRWGLALRLTALLVGIDILFCLVEAREALLGGAALLVPTLSLFYFLNLCVNCAEAFALRSPKPVSRFAWGLLLFMGCDICVGAFNLGLLGDFARVGMWLFYLPSQVLIVLSQPTFSREKR